MKKLIIFILSASTCLSYGLEIQFEGGNQIEMETREGYVTERCQDGNIVRINNYFCSDRSLSSGSFAAVEVLNESIDADWVTLQRVGSRYIKGVQFNSREGKSTKKINLWVGTLFQRPLLVEGENTIKYRFSKKKNTVLEGEFIVNVVSGELISCRSGSIYSGYCRGYYSACEEYLYRGSNCR